ncbi:MAG: PD40 domain-containing protein [Phycisphaerae bacterium]|nr:PD40 domain-containing protein [Phycisphaerae bacterium]
MFTRSIPVVTILFACLGAGGIGRAAEPPPAQDVVELAEEVRGKGWIVFGARSKEKDWDLYLMRPDGSGLRNITNTPDYAEAAPRFSPDGTRLLYRRLPRGSIISHDLWGFQGNLIMANADGSEPVVYGEKGQYPWACWGPEGKRIACLTRQGIEIVEVATKRLLRKLKRKGFYQQLFWSPDGKWFCGTANYLGQQWTIARMNVGTGEVNAVSEAWACTPDWLADSRRVIFAHNPKDVEPKEGGGWTQLWVANGDGTNRQAIYAQRARHVYGGATSPDGKYVLMTISVIDGGLSEWSGAPMALMRMSDAPVVGPQSRAFREMYHDAKEGPLLPLPTGWEPHWTYAEANAERSKSGHVERSKDRNVK